MWRKPRGLLSDMAQRILIAEDEPNIVESLRFVLNRAGFEVSVRDNGGQVLEALRETVPDVLILDVMLPEIDGFEILRRLRANPETKTLPVLMLTAKGQREDRERAIKLGANQFMSKPFGNSELIEAVIALASLSEATPTDTPRAAGAGAPR